VAATEADIGIPTLRAADPYLAFSKALELFYEPPPLPEGIHPTAVIAPTAAVGAGARIGPYCVVGEKARLGANACLDAHVVIYPEVRIGDEFRAYAGVVVRERVAIGDRVILQSGCVIGGDGFGYVNVPGEIARKIVQAGSVILEDDVEVGCNTTVDRAAVGNTVIGRGTKLDNLVMVAHGCTVGESSFVAAQTGLSGSTHVGRFVRMGGQVGSSGHLTIGDGSQIAARSGVTTDVEAGTTVGGFPAIDIRIWRRMTAALPRLPELLRRARRIEARLGMRRQGDD
jgi:UDP-3-O-[3-hydroxymyristoyl] glucosamine N-acyltransferase